MDQAGWRKSSYSAYNGSCVLCQPADGAVWRKSSHSESNGHRVEFRKSARSASGDCVEVGGGDGTMLVRDSKNPDGPHLTFSAAAWQAFVDSLKIT